MKTTVTNIRKLAPKYGDMFRAVYRAQWDIGKTLHEDGIISSGQQSELGRLIGVSAETLKTYYEVYREFNQRWPEGRPDNVPHGVLEKLLKVDEAARDDFFARHPNPTNAQAEVFVSRWLSARRGKSRSNAQDSQTVRVGGVTFYIHSTEGGAGSITVAGSPKVGDAQPGLQDGTWKIDFLTP